MSPALATPVPFRVSFTLSEVLMINFNLREPFSPPLSSFRACSLYIIFQHLWPPSPSYLWYTHLHFKEQATDVCQCPLSFPLVHAFVIRNSFLGHVDVKLTDVTKIPVAVKCSFHQFSVVFSGCYRRIFEFFCFCFRSFVSSLRLLTLFTGAFPLTSSDASSTCSG